VDPPAEQSNPAVPWTSQEIVAKQLTNQREDLRIGGGMKSVAAVVDLQTRKREAARVAADAVGLFEDRDVVTLASES
jgi:hypothetical protein